VLDDRPYRHVQAVGPRGGDVLDGGTRQQVFAYELNHRRKAYVGDDLVHADVAEPGRTERVGYRATVEKCGGGPGADDGAMITATCRSYR